MVTHYDNVHGTPHFLGVTMEIWRMHKQCVPGPLLSYIGSGYEATVTTVVADFNPNKCTSFFMDDFI